MQRTVLFVAGIHGVGKTFFCKQVAKDLDTDHISASTLIRRAKQRLSEQSKAVANVSQNQNALIAELHKHHWQAPILLLDGHFCLLTTQNTIQAIPKDTFEQMKPASVILLQDKVETIQQRLLERDSIAYSLELLESLQVAETNQANNICAELSIPLLVGTSGEMAEALDFIRRTTTLQKD